MGVQYDTTESSLGSGVMRGEDSEVGIMRVAFGGIRWVGLEARSDWGSGRGAGRGWGEMVGVMGGVSECGKWWLRMV
ncbi:hypothetical protein Tco_0232801 [Tanacetum coccineum]